MTNYTKGVKLENEVIDIFKKAGYEAFRSAGSHSPFDVVLIKYTEPIPRFNQPGGKRICFVAFVQCKASKMRAGKEQPDTPGHSPEQLSKLLSKS